MFEKHSSLKANQVQLDLVFYVVFLPAILRESSKNYSFVESYLPLRAKNKNLVHFNIFSKKYFSLNAPIFINTESSTLKWT